MSETKFVMTDDEIAESYRRADNRRKQIQVLADLNGTSKANMETKLQEMGLAQPAAPKIPKAPSSRRFKVLDEELAMALYNEGLADPEIAERMGVSKTTVCTWRRQNDLLPNAPSPRPAGFSGAEPVAGMTVAKLSELLDAVDAAYKDAVVSLDDACVVGMDLLVSMDAAGNKKSCCVRLRTKEACHV